MNLPSPGRLEDGTTSTVTFVMRRCGLATLAGRQSQVVADTGCSVAPAVNPCLNRKSPSHGRQPRGLVCSSGEFRLHTSPLVAYTLIVVQEMNPARDALIFQRGCLAVSILLIGLGCLAYFVDKSFLWGVGGIILIWEVICRLKGGRDKKRLESAFARAFEGFDGAFPQLKKTSSYGFPSFSVCFSSKEDMKRGFERGHLNAFRTAVHELYGFGGFDIEKGFEETYSGWEGDYLESWDPESKNSRFKDPMKNSWIVERLRLRGVYYDHLQNQKDAEQAAASDGDKPPN